MGGNSDTEGVVTSSHTFEVWVKSILLDSLPHPVLTPSLRLTQPRLPVYLLIYSLNWPAGWTYYR